MGNRNVKRSKSSVIKNAERVSSSVNPCIVQSRSQSLSQVGSPDASGSIRDSADQSMHKRCNTSEGTVFVTTHPVDRSSLDDAYSSAIVEPDDSAEPKAVISRTRSSELTRDEIRSSVGHHHLSPIKSLLFYKTRPLSANLISDQNSTKQEERLTSSSTSECNLLAQGIERRPFSSSQIAPTNSIPTSRQSTGCSLQLSPAQLVLVRKTWAHARNQGTLEPGLSIFRNSFFKCAEIRSLLMAGPKNTGHECLKLHAKKLTIIMDCLIGGLGSLENIVDDLRAVGAAHYPCSSEQSIHRSDSIKGLFRPAHLDHLASAMIERTLEWGEKRDRNEISQTAWTMIVLFVIEQIRDGYQQAVRKGRRAARVLSSQIRGSSEAQSLFDLEQTAIGPTAVAVTASMQRSSSTVVTPKKMKDKDWNSIGRFGTISHFKSDTK